MSKSDIYQCPKCKYYSGDDWEQCNGKCPVPRSPHFDEGTSAEYGGLVLLGHEPRGARSE